MTETSPTSPQFSPQAYQEERCAVLGFPGPQALSLEQPAPWAGSTWDMKSKSDETVTSQQSFEQGLRALLLLNLMDAFFTLQWLDKGKADEANPIMAFALEHGPEFFILSKVALVSLAVGLLWKHKDRFTARLALVPLALLYAYVAGGHLGFALSEIIAPSFTLP